MSGMKIYFAGSIRGGREDAALYAKLVTFLKGYGEVLTEHVGNDEMLKRQEESLGSDIGVHTAHIEMMKTCDDESVDDKFIHDRDLDWLKQSDVLVAEVTQVSLGVGYEIGRAVAMNKRVLCLYRPSEGKRLSAMIGGAVEGDNFMVKNYKESDFEAILKEYMDKIKK